MKLFHFFLICIAIFCTASPAVAGDDLPADPTPMDILNFLRSAAIKNDSSMALQVIHGQLQEQMLNTGKMPKDLRQKLLNLETAFEDTYIRHTSDEAIVYAIIDQNGRKECIKFKFDKIAGGILRFSNVSQGRMPEAREYLDRFLKACNDGNEMLFGAYLSDALQAKFPVIPIGLQEKCSNNVKIQKNGSEEVVFSVTRNGITGTIRLTREKDSFFWKIVEIDPILTAPGPKQILRQIAQFAQVFAKHSAAVEQLEQQREAAFEARRTEKIKFYEECQKNAQENPDLKDLIGAPAQVIREYYENIINKEKKEHNDLKITTEEYYENIISPSEAEVELVLRYEYDETEHHIIAKIKLTKNDDKWDFNSKDVPDTSLEWFSDIKVADLINLTKTAVEAAKEKFSPFFVAGFFDQEMFTYVKVSYSLFEFLTKYSEWQSQTAQNGDLAVKVRNPDSNKSEVIIFTRIGQQWKIKEIPSIKYEPPKPANENNAESADENHTGTNDENTL